MEKDLLTGEEFSEKQTITQNLNEETTSDDNLYDVTSIQNRILDELNSQIGELKERMTDLEVVTLDTFEKFTIARESKISR